MAHRNWATAGLALISGAFAPDALAQEKTVTCLPGQPVSAEYVELNLTIDTLELQNDMSDAGGNYEMSLRVLPVVYAVGPQGKPGTQICAPGPVLYKRSLPVLNAWTGQTSDFSVDFRLRFVGVPRDAMVRYAIVMNEEDSSSGDDNADLSPLPTSRELLLDAYPRNLRGVVEPDAPGGPFDTFEFARHKRIEGDGRGPGVDFLAGLSFTLTRAGAGAPTPPPTNSKGMSMVQMRCAGYAFAAIRQQVSNKAMGCGYTGRDWDSQALAHYNWCMSGVPSATTYDEQKRRDVMLQSCPNGNKSVLQNPRFKTCYSYATEAAIQALESHVLSCGGQPPAWNTEAAVHYLWCMQGANDQFTQAESQKRIAVLNACRK